MLRSNLGRKRLDKLGARQKQFLLFIYLLAVTWHEISFPLSQVSPKVERKGTALLMRLKKTIRGFKTQGPEDMSSSPGSHSGLQYLVISLALPAAGLSRAYAFSTLYISQDPGPESSLSDLLPLHP